MTAYTIWEECTPNEPIQPHLAFNGLEKAKQELFKFLTDRMDFKPENIRQIPSGGYYSYYVECHFEREPEYKFYYFVRQIEIL